MSFLPFNLASNSEACLHHQSNQQVHVQKWSELKQWSTSSQGSVPFTDLLNRALGVQLALFDDVSLKSGGEVRTRTVTHFFFVTTAIK